MFVDFSNILMCFHKYIAGIGAIFGAAGAILIGFSNRLIPYGLRLRKEDRHPFRTRPRVFDAAGQGTSSWEEWWGGKLKNFGWFLLVMSFVIQIFITWP